MLTGIIGGGLSGVSLQHFLDGPSEILEKEERTGGLCRTFEKDGFLFDIGGHILFSGDKALLDTITGVLGKNVERRRRNNQILFKDRYVKYPFENGLGGLDKQDTYECLMGYLQNEHPSPTNFKEWMYHVFGDGITDKYLLPYNRKIWKFPPEEMGLDWVERVPRPPLEDIVKSALDIETEGYLHQLYFYYPVRGGIESLIKALGENGSAITTGFEAVEIRRDKQGWVVSDGKGERGYDRLVLTSPVTDALRYFEDVPKDVVDAAGGLRHNAVRIVLVGVDNESLLDKSAVYIPGDDMVAHRICFMGYFSRKMVPKGKSSLVAEITARAGHELRGISDASLTERVVDELHNAGIIDRRDVVVTDVKTIEYAYVLHDIERPKNMAVIGDYFDSLGIHLHGRFSQFEYINMDEVIRRSIELAGRLSR